MLGTGPGPLPTFPRELLRDLPNASEKARIFGQYCFLYMARNMSDFVMGLDLTTIDFLMSHEAWIELPPTVSEDLPDTVAPRSVSL